MENTKFYYQGDLAEYTGKSEILFGKKCYEIEILQGPFAGQKKFTYRDPITGKLDI